MITNLPINVTIFTVNDRAINDIYTIGSNQIQSFIFTVPVLGQVKIATLQHDNRPSFSIRIWLSLLPNGSELFFRFHPGTGGSNYLFADEDIDPLPTPVIFSTHRNKFSGITFDISEVLVTLPAGIYYYNVHNIENFGTGHTTSFITIL